MQNPSWTVKGVMYASMMDSNSISWGLERFQGETPICCQVHQECWQFLAGNSAALQRSSELLTHEGTARKCASYQFSVAGRVRWAQVCSLAQVNKRKTGAIWQTCRAWNSFLMFTPFTLELLQRRLAWCLTEPLLRFAFGKFANNLSDVEKCVNWWSVYV